MRKLFILIVFLLNFLSASSQDTDLIKLKKDSLTRVEGVRKASILIDLSSEYMQINIDSSLRYARKSKILADYLNNAEYKALSECRIGYLYMKKGKKDTAKIHLFNSLKYAHESQSSKAILQSNNFTGVYYNSINKLDTAIYYFKQNLILSKEINNYRYELRSNFNIASIHYILGRYSTAIKYFFEVLEELEIRDDLDLRVKLLINIANVYMKIEDYDKAIYYYKKAAIISKKRKFYNNERLAYSNMAYSYIKKKEYSLSLEYLNKIDPLSVKLSDFSNNYHYYNQYGIIYLRLEDYKKSDYYLQKALTAAKKYDNRKDILISYRYLIELRLLNGRYNEAYIFLRNATSILKNTNNLYAEKNIYRLYSEYYFKTKNYKKAYLYRLDYEKIKDSMVVINKLRLVEDTRTKYESERVEFENSKLKSDRLLSQLSIKHKSEYIYILIFSLIMMILFICFALYESIKRKKTNRSLALLNTELSKANDTKNKFFAILSHDLRSPFNTIIGFSILLKEEIDSINATGNLIKYSSEILQSSERTLDLLDSLLSWAKLQSGNLIVKHESLCMSSIFKSVLDIYKANLVLKGIECNILCNDECTVMGDRDIVLTIFRNLLSNSIKFTEKGGKIDMDCTVIDDKTIFFIRDNGVGISEDRQKKIFSSTEKISERGTYNEIGSGLGLILIKDLAIENGGDLWFDSIEGEGATFYVSFIS